MISAQAAAAVMAGFALVATLTGALAALTAIPAPAMLACAAVLLRSLNRSTAAPLVAGLIAGLLLPHAPPPIARAVVTRAPARHAAGDLFDALDRIDRDPRALLGRRLSVTGIWQPASAHASASVARFVMTCCAADAVAVGFDVFGVGRIKVRAGSLARVTGTLIATLRDGEIRYALDRATVEP